MSKKSQNNLVLSDDKVFLGVFGGIALHFGWSESLLRVVGAILIALSGIVPGIIIYFILAAIMRSED